jgi:hypothetical protein
MGQQSARQNTRQDMANSKNIILLIRLLPSELEILTSLTDEIWGPILSKVRFREYEDVAAGLL